MKIGYFTDGYLPEPNGVATSVAASVANLRRRGHRVYVIAPKHPGANQEKDVYRLTSVNLSKNAGVRVALALLEKSLADVLKIDFDIIHGHAGGPITFLGWQIAKLKNVPFVGTYHTLWNRYTHYILQGKLIKPKVMEVATRVFGNLCDCLIAPSVRVKKELLSYGVTKPIVIIPSGLELSRFDNVRKGFLRKKFKLSRQAKILLYVGRLGQEKSVDFLIRSFRLIQQKHADTYLVLVGDGPDRSDLEKLAKRLGIQKNTIFTGFIPQEEIPRVYADSDIFVFASKTETQGMVVIEALASRLPVVAIRDAAFEGVVSSGKNGFLVRENQKKFAKKVNYLLESPAKLEEISARSFADSQRFSVEKTAKDLENLYHKIIAEHARKKKVTDRFKEKLQDLKSFLDVTQRINKIKNIITAYTYMSRKL